MADTARETTDEARTDAAPHVCFDRILPQVHIEGSSTLRDPEPERELESV